MKTASFFGISHSLLFFICVFNCNNNTENPLQPSKNSIPKFSIAKWYQIHTTAITLTHDHGDPSCAMNSQVNLLLIANGLKMDFEIVTERYLTYK
jgi:hypothetical protein